MDSILINLPGVCCFVDDILVAAKTETEHLNRLKAVFKRLQENDVLIKPEKCVFMTKEISYLGFKITDKGLFKTDEKIKAIKESLAPTNVSEVRSFLGLVTFYSKFVPNLATIAAPIYQLTRKNVSFDWNEECQKAFQSLKQELISNRFLTYFNPKLPLIVSCDASPVGLGAVLAHKLPSGEEKPIAYASRTLSNSERNYSQIDKESLAIIFAVKHFHFFLYGKDRFTIYTDHKPLISLFGAHAKLPTLVAARLQRWALTLSAYNYKIEYRTGANNGNADALSRKPLVQTNLNAQIDGTTNNVLNIETIPFNVSYDEMVRGNQVIAYSTGYISKIEGNRTLKGSKYKNRRRSMRMIDILHFETKNLELASTSNFPLAHHHIQRLHPPSCTARTLVRCTEILGWHL